MSKVIYHRRARRKFGGDLTPLWETRITRKMMDLFFTQDLGSRSKSKAAHHGDRSEVARRKI
jgi:hypothetical protein